EAFSNKKATLRWLKFRIFGFTRRIGAQPPSAVGFVLQKRSWSAGALACVRYSCSTAASAVFFGLLEWEFRDRIG
ncbi:MAG TPA: hypothetical protein VE604_07515, partial [Candidatus Polarisedimenticolia bacterium]|nr:hypothetical protein [Candidatus Polarisedimenticolia bacterium]